MKQAFLLSVIIIFVSCHIVSASAPVFTILGTSSIKVSELDVGRDGDPAGTGWNSAPCWVDFGTATPGFTSGEHHIIRDELNDLFIGDKDGNVWFYKNIGTEQEPVFDKGFILQANTIDDTTINVNVGHNAAPFLIDWDRDCDMDLIVGNSKGTFYYYENMPDGNGSAVFQARGELTRGPVLAAQTSTVGSAQDVFVVGKYAYVAAGEMGLQIFDISNPYKPILVGGYDSSGSAQGVFVRGNYAYLADGVEGLRIVDITDPKSPKETGGLAPRNPQGVKKPQKDDGVQPGAMDVYVVGNYAFVACGIGGMQVVDITDPTKPNAGKDDRHGFDVPAGGCSNGVYAVGNHVYVAAGNAGLQVLRIDDFFPTITVGTATIFGIGTNGSTGIIQLGVVDTPGCAMDLWINPNTSERYVYVADEKGGLQIIDVGEGFDVSSTDMTAAALLTTNIPFADAQNVFVKIHGTQTIAYVSDGANGFQMVNITDPTTPQKILGAAYNTKDYTSAVWVQDGFIYAADRMAGLAIFNDYNPPDTQGRNLVNVDAYHSSPHIFDLDEDGFCDLLSGDEHGYVWFFHNQGALSNPSFNDGFRIRGSSSSGLIDVGQYSAPWIVDYNGDGVKDLIVGNETGSVLFYEGYETIPLPTDSIEGLIPLATRNRYLAFKPPKTIKVSNRDIDAGFCSCPIIGDWNNDGGMDLIVGNKDGKINIFLNIKTWPGEEPLFNASFNVRGQQPHDLLQGEYSVPFVVDWDSDGKKDLIIGDVDGYVTYFRNSGTNTANPEFSSGFRPQRTGPGGMMDVRVDGGYGVPVAFDWDMDGLKDLIIGDFHGKVWFFKNIGTNPAPVFGTPTQMLSNNAPIDVGQYAAPFVCDWNHDGQKDLVVGNENGSCLLFLNIGTANGTPTLGTPTTLSNTSGDIDVGKFARPWVIDYDGDWLDDLIVGDINGNITVYCNMGNEQLPEYNFGENIQFDDETVIDTGQCAAPCIVDWDNNGTLDLLSGNKEGFIQVFTSSQGTESVGIDESITLKAGVNDWPCFRYDAARDACNPGETLALPLDVYWTYSAKASIVSSPVILGGTVGICSKDGMIHVIDAVDVQVAFATETNTSIDSTPIAIGNTIYVGGHDGIVHCLDWSNSEEKWTYQTGGSIQWSSPMVVNGRLYVGSSDERMYCLNAGGGEFLWSYKTTGIIESSPAVANGRVYFGSMDGNVYCIDAVNGAFKWKYSIGSPIHSTPCIKNNILYVGADNGKVYAIKTSDGALQWSYQTGKPIRSSVAINNYSIYFGGEDGVFYCIDALTGRLKWSYYIGSPIHSSPIVAGGIVYVGADNGRIYALNPEAISTNRLSWSYQTKGKIICSPAAAGNLLFVTSEDGNCYAFGPKRFLGSSKTVSANVPVSPGGTVGYTINIMNATDIDAITVIDELDASLTNPVNISNDGTTTTQNGRTVIVWKDINPQSVNSLSFNVSVSPDVAPGAIINNTARIDWAAGSFTIPAAIIRVAGTISATKRMIPNKQDVSPDEAVEYAITCKNIMGITIHKLTIADDIDPNLTAIVPLNNGVYDAKTRRITWQIMSDIANGKEVVVRFQAKIVSIVAGGNGTVIDNNTASFWSSDTGTNTIHAEPEMVTVSVPDFSGSVNQVRAPNVIRSGSVISYDIVYINQGAMATDVVVVAKVDDNLSVIAPSISNFGVYSPNYRLITWRLGQIESNESGTVSYKATIKSPIDNQTQIANNAAISCRQMETQPLAAPVIITDNKPEFNYSGIEVFPRDGTGPYDIISYTITCVNSGDMNAVEVRVVDSLSQYLSLGSLTSQQEVIGNGSVDLHGNWNQFDSGLVDGNIMIRTNYGTYTSREISLANYPNVLTLKREIDASPAKVILSYLPIQDRFVLECRNNGWIIELKETGLLPFFSCIKIPVCVYCDSGASYDANTRELSWNIGEIPAGSSTTLKFKAQLLPGIGTVTNNAIIYWGTESTGTGSYRIDPVYTNVDTTAPIIGQISIEGTINNQDEDADTDGAYKIFWKPWQDQESGVDTYCLQESMDMKNWGTLSDNIIGTQLSYSISGKGKGNSYYYRLKARNHAGLWSDFTLSSDGIRVVDSFGVVKTGTISTIIKDGCRVSVPNDAFAGTITLIIRKVTNQSALYAPGRNSVIFNESIVELAALPDAYYGSNIQPTNPITLTLSYPDPDTFNETEDYNYRIFKLTENGSWEIVDEKQAVSSGSDTVTVSVSSLSCYAVGRVGDSVDDIVVKPNPVRGNSTKVKFCNATTGDVWIYNTAGELVRIQPMVEGVLEWDTRNGDGDLVSSGIYVFVIENGQGDRKTGVIGIIR